MSSSKIQKLPGGTQESSGGIDKSTEGIHESFKIMKKRNCRKKEGKAEGL